LAVIRFRLLRVKVVLTCAVLVALLLPPFITGQSIHVEARDPLVVVKDGHYGYIDRTGAFVIPPQFLWARAFEDGFATVFACGRYVWVDASGQVYPERPSIAKRGPSWKRIGDNGRYAFVDASGHLNASLIFDDVLPFSDGFAAVQVGDKWGFVDSSGQLAIPPKYDAGYYSIEGVATVLLGNETLLIDKTGKVLARGYDQLSGIVAEGRVPVSRGDKYGYLDLTGNVAIPFVYDDADTFSEGLAPVKKGKKWGYIDKQGAVVIPFVFDSAGVYGSGLAPVQVAGESGFINSSGKFAFRLVFAHSAGFDSSGVAVFWTKDKLVGYVDTTGHVFWGPTKEDTDHAPIVGWSEEDKVASCECLPRAMREKVAAFPKSE
jgi:hypothetical protein